ncbi:ICP22 family protein [Mycolicibacterium mengxianglii]|uniref:hypothetical protein n=1 Tax=Mycolicibacterium mengxianglii TaxID=2736649 RepID=UPI0018EF13BF|nr:hypothetical protein [Mycolicibacterium mengxianglii]
MTVVQPLTAAPPLLLAALLMDGRSGDDTGVSGVAAAIQDRLLPSNGRGVIVNFLTGPFGIWNSIGDSENPGSTVPSTTLGVASGLPFLGQQGLSLDAPQLPLLPAVPPAVPGAAVPPWPVVSFDVPSLQIGNAIVTPPPPVGPSLPPDGVVTDYGYSLSEYTGVAALNPFAVTNSVAAYLNRALSPVQVSPDGSLVCRDNAPCNVDELEIERYKDADGVLHITFRNPDGSVVKATIKTRDGVTYVTYDDAGPLPLVRPLRDYGGLLGNELADVLEPALTALVYWGYRDATGESGNGILPSPAETIQSLLDFVVGVVEGVKSLFEAHTPVTATVQPLARAEEPTTTPTEEPIPGPAGEPRPEPTPEPDNHPQPPPSLHTTIGDVVKNFTGIFHGPAGGADNEDEPVDTGSDEEPADEPADDEQPADDDEAPATDPVTDGDEADGPDDPDKQDPSDDKGAGTGEGPGDSPDKSTPQGNDSTGAEN